MSSVYHFLLSQPPEDMNTLYRSPWCALAVYQSLDSLAKQCVAARRAHGRAGGMVGGLGKRVGG